MRVPVSTCRSRITFPALAARLQPWTQADEKLMRQPRPSHGLNHQSLPSLSVDTTPELSGAPLAQELILNLLLNQTFLCTSALVFSWRLGAGSHLLNQTGPLALQIAADLLPTSFPTFFSFTQLIWSLLGSHQDLILLLLALFLLPRLSGGIYLRNSFLVKVTLGTPKSTSHN